MTAGRDINGDSSDGNGNGRDSNGKKRKEDGRSSKAIPGMSRKGSIPPKGGMSGKYNKPSKRNMFQRADPNNPGQVGRRPSKPSFLALISLMWIAAGGLTLAYLHASWKLVPAIVYFGLGILYLRAAVASYMRQQRY